MMTRKLDFLIIGAMKSGTTTLHDYLSTHPGVCLASPKEPQYFSRDNVFAKGELWYSTLFSAAKIGQLWGESSTCYSRSPKYKDAAKRIYDYSPKAKIIYIMRHPVDRAYSHYGHLVLNDGKQFNSFEDAIEQEEEIISASKYMFQIQQYMNFYSKEQLLLIDFDEFVNSPQKILMQVQIFLGLDLAELYNVKKISNDAGSSKIRRNTIKNIRLIRHLPLIKFLIDRVLTKEKREDILNFITKNILNSKIINFQKEKLKSELGAMSIETRSRLLVELHSDTELLFKFWGRTIPAWFK